MIMDDLAVGGERRWIGWLGGVAMLVICLAPIALLVFVGHGMRLTWGGHDAGFEFDYGGALSEAPGILAVALLAPLAGFKRRVVLWWLLPPRRDLLRLRHRSARGCAQYASRPRSCGANALGRSASRGPYS